MKLGRRRLQLMYCQRLRHLASLLASNLIQIIHHNGLGMQVPFRRKPPCHLDKHNQQLFLRETEQERGGFAAIPRLFQRPPGNSRFAGYLLDSKVIQRVEIAKSPVKRAFRGVCPSSVLAV